MRSRFVFPFAVGVLLLCALLVSCKEKRDSFGEEFIHENEKLVMQMVTSNNLIASTISDEPYRVDRFDYFAVGEIHDQIFGSSRIGMLAEFAPRIPDAPNYKKGQLIKSLALKLKVRKRFGTEDLTVEVRKIPEKLNSAFYKKKLEDFDSYPLLGSADVSASDQEVLVNLETPIAEKILEHMLKPDFLYETFPDVFHGIYIVAKRKDPTGEGQMLEFNRADDQNCLIITWKDENSIEQKFDLSIWGFSKRFFLIDNDLSGSQLESVLAKDAMTQQQSGEVLLHGDGGSRLEIDFSKFRDEWKAKGALSIQRAKLTIPVSTDNPKYSDTVVQRVLCFVRGEDRDRPLPDLDLSEDVYDGYYNRSQKCFTLNVTRFVQELLQDPAYPCKLVIMTKNEFIGINRLILKNASPSGDRKLSLDITYTAL